MLIMRLACCCPNITHAIDQNGPLLYEGDKMAFGANSTIRELMENERASVVERHLPGASSHPQLSQAWYMTLREVSYYPEAGMTPAQFEAIVNDLATIEG